jgi:hypothetical protein
VVAALALLALAACGGGSAAPAGPVAAAPTPSAPPPATPAPSPSASPAPTPAPSPAPSHVHAPVVDAGWVGPIYPPRAHGYDVSYPQCSATRPPAGASFSIVGVNDGRAFTTNPCLAAQWRTARQPRAVYFNSGYLPDNAGKATADCRARGQLLDGSDARRTAYAIGCSEAVYALAAARAAGADRAAMIWIDVESSNSWDADQELNRTSLQAEVDQLAAYGRLVGLYGTFAEWHGIVGDWSPQGVVADWVAGGTPGAGCRDPGFSGHPVWLVQELDAWPGSGQDSDWAC